MYFELYWFFHVDEDGTGVQASLLSPSMQKLAQVWVVPSGVNPLPGTYVMDSLAWLAHWHAAAIPARLAGLAAAWTPTSI